MARAIFPPDLQRCAGGAREIEVAARSYRALVSELRQRFPAITDELIGRQAVAIDGIIFQTPLLETFNGDSEIVFFARIAGG